MEVGEGVNVDGIGRMTPGLYLLSHFLRVWRGENANYASGFEGLGEVIQKSGDSVRKTDGGEDTWAEEGVSAEGIEKGVFWAGNIGVNP